MLNQELFHYVKSQLPDPTLSDLDIRLLISAALQISADEIYREPKQLVDSDKLFKLDAFIGRKKSGEPTLLIIGATEFYGYPVRVFPHVLIPRPETEQLVSLALENTPKSEATIHLVEVGTGSGCIVTSVAMELIKHSQSFKFTGLEKSPEAYLATIYNLEQNLGIKSQNGHFKGSNFEINIQQEAFSSDIHLANIDVIVTNPPYLTGIEYAGLDNSVLNYEPQMALLGGQDGLEVYQQIYRLLANNNEKPLLFLEIGPVIARDILSLFEPLYPQAHIVRDFFGLERFLLGQ